VDGCVFCRIVCRELPADVVYEDDRVLVILDLHPVAPGHCLVLPKAHSDDLSEVSDEDAAALLKVARHMGQELKRTWGAEGFNVLSAAGRAAQQSVFHTHLHLVPRRAGDGLDLWFCPKP